MLTEKTLKFMSVYASCGQNHKQMYSLTGVLSSTLNSRHCRMLWCHVKAAFCCSICCSKRFSDVVMTARLELNCSVIKQNKAVKVCSNAMAFTHLCLTLAWCGWNHGTCFILHAWRAIRAWGRDTVCVLCRVTPLIHTYSTYCTSIQYIQDFYVHSRGLCTDLFLHFCGSIICPWFGPNNGNIFFFNHYFCPIKTMYIKSCEFCHIVPHQK